MVRFAAGIVAWLLLWACTQGQEPRILVSIDGSSTVYPVVEAIAEEFQLENPRMMVTPGRSGTGGGFDRFCRGETDISTASRGILPHEAAACESRGVEYYELPIAMDGLSVIVSSQNDFVQCLTVGELRSIWRPGSRVRTWRDVRPEFPAAEIQLYGPGTDSGTFDTFTGAIVGEVGASRTDFQASEDDNILVQGISGDRFALGFFGYSYVEGNRGRLGVVAVDGGRGCVEPSEETIQEGSYDPLSRPLFLYVRRSSMGDPGPMAFLSYFMTNAGDIIPETGFVPLSEETYRTNLAVLAIGAGGGPEVGENPTAEGDGGGEGDV
jgi:phosphate transport system substrate-binding protein